jgi:UDPglucose 6-dehydrogenase
VGTTSTIRRPLARGDVGLASNPEFCGSAARWTTSCIRTVVGAQDEEATATRVAQLYDRLDAPVVLTDPVSTELIKYALNLFLALKLAYVNNIAELCDQVGGDITAIKIQAGTVPQA